MRKQSRNRVVSKNAIRAQVIDELTRAFPEERLRSNERRVIADRVLELFAVRALAPSALKPKVWRSGKKHLLAALRQTV
jgi:hypothetical protein